MHTGIEALLLVCEAHSIGSSKTIDIINKLTMYIYKCTFNYCCEN